MGGELSQRLGAKLSISPELAWGLVQPYWHRFLCGRITENDLWKHIEKQYGAPISSTQRDIWDRWDDTMRPLPEMLNLVRNLRDSNHVVGMLTNVIPPTERIVRQHHGYDGFDFLILSCEVGAAKPDLEIYQLALEKLNGIKPEEVVLLDDQERFLTPARKLGMRTIYVKEAKQAVQDVNALL